MNIKRIIGTFVIGLCALWIGAASAEVELKTFKNYRLAEPAVDIAVSKNSKWIYVLTDKGTVKVFTLEGDVKDEVEVGIGVNRIEPGPQDDILFLSNSKNGTLRMVLLDFVHDIDVDGSPFKGPEDAPITVAVFSDFE